MNVVPPSPPTPKMNAVGRKIMNSLNLDAEAPLRIANIKGFSTIIVYLALFLCALVNLLLFANDQFFLATAIDLDKNKKDHLLMLFHHCKLILVFTLIFYFSSWVVHLIVRGINRLGNLNRLLVTMVVTSLCHSLREYVEKEQFVLISFITVMIITSAACFNERDTTGMLDGVMVGFIDLTFQLLFFTEKWRPMEAVITTFVFGTALFIKATEVPLDEVMAETLDDIAAPLYRLSSARLGHLLGVY